VDELVQWLTAQLDEDQQAAEEALKRTTTTRRRIGGQWVEDTVQPPEWRRSAWSPARVLREIDAKRRILAEHALNGWVCTTCDNGEVEQVFPCPTLRILALPYADRPDFQEAWRP
jgi:hypothetical protein